MHRRIDTLTRVGACLGRARSLAHGRWKAAISSAEVLASPSLTSRPPRTRRCRRNVCARNGAATAGACCASSDQPAGPTGARRARGRPRPGSARAVVASGRLLITGCGTRHLHEAVSVTSPQWTLPISPCTDPPRLRGPARVRERRALFVEVDRTLVGEGGTSGREAERACRRHMSRQPGGMSRARYRVPLGRAVQTDIGMLHAAAIGGSRLWPYVTDRGAVASVSTESPAHAAMQVHYVGVLRGRMRHAWSARHRERRRRDRAVHAEGPQHRPPVRPLPPPSRSTPNRTRRGYGQRWYSVRLDLDCAQPARRSGVRRRHLRRVAVGEAGASQRRRTRCGSAGRAFTPASSPAAAGAVLGDRAGDAVAVLHVLRQAHVDAGQPVRR